MKNKEDCDKCAFKVKMVDELKERKLMREEKCDCCDCKKVLTVYTVMWFDFGFRGESVRLLQLRR